MDIFNGLHLNEEEENKFIVTQAFDDFYIGETNESYDSYTIQNKLRTNFENALTF